MTAAFHITVILFLYVYHQKIHGGSVMFYGGYMAVCCPSVSTYFVCCDVSLLAGGI